MRCRMITKQDVSLMITNDRGMTVNTLRIELSCLVFFVSYPSRRHRRTVLPDPANSDRFKSAKPSFAEMKIIKVF